jgi:hypothetical protein
LCRSWNHSLGYWIYSLVITHHSLLNCSNPEANIVDGCVWRILPHCREKGRLTKGGQLFKQGGMSDRDGQNAVSHTAYPGLVAGRLADGGFPGCLEFALRADLRQASCREECG